MERRVRLIVNPSSGGGRALGGLPTVQAALERLGVPYETFQTTSLDHGRELAVEGAARGETVAALSGDGLVGAVAGALATSEHDGVLGVLPGGRGNDLARVLGIPLDDLGAACAVLRDGVERPLDVGCVGADRPFIGIASLGFDSDANRIANEAPPRLGNLVYAYGALRALAAWKPATFTLSLDGGPPQTHTGYSVAFANSKAYGGGMY
ncbi:MAG TPA: diacylglycerol kinase family protein, partial [Capillimicrobium sp.]